jgi:hypothetical protein
VSLSENRKLETRLVHIAAWLAAAGGVLTWFFFDARHALSFFAGSLLAGVSILWLRRVLDSAFLQERKAPKGRVLAGFLLRLLLIPLCLYAMIRFLFLSVPAAVAGFAVIHGCILVEGILEIISGSAHNARAK